VFYDTERLTTNRIIIKNKRRKLDENTFLLVGQMMKSKNPKSLYKEISPLGKNQNKQVIAR